MLSVTVAAESGGVQIPLGWVAIAAGAMAAVIIALWRWGLGRQKKIDDLQRQLLEEKEQKAHVFEQLVKKAEEAKKKGTDRKEKDVPK